MFMLILVVNQIVLSGHLPFIVPIIIHLLHLN